MTPSRMTMSVEAIDDASWGGSLLPFPKGFSRSRAFGFCGGHAVGMAERLRSKSLACWWPEGRPELLALDGYKDLRTLLARGDAIPGAWSKGFSMGAAAWRLRGGALEGIDLHDKQFERTWAECAEHGLVLGVATHKGKMGARAPDSGLVWRDGGDRQEMSGAGDVSLKGTDGTQIVGSVAGRAALWPRVADAPLDLHPQGFASSEVRAIDADTQVGVVFKGLGARAALWRGTAASFVDLTPAGYEVSRAFHAARGWQVGLVRRTDVTANGSASLADQAALWHGSADRWIDLNALLPAASGLNASAAWAIERKGDRVVICGEASRYETRDPGTDRESHFLPAAQAVIWTARVHRASGRSA